MFYPGALLKAKKGHMIRVLIINVISLITLTEEVMDQLFPEKRRPFFEALLSNVTLLYFARTIYVFIIPYGGNKEPAASHPHSCSVPPPHSVQRGQREIIEQQ